MFDWLQYLAGTLQTIVSWLWRQTIALMIDHPWATAAAGLAIARMFGTVIETGWRGVLFSFGKVKSELEPGFHWLAPIVHHVRKVRVRSLSLDLPRQRIVTRDGLAYDVEANLVYRIADPQRAVVQIDDVQRGCLTVIPLVVADLLRERDSRRLSDRSQLDAELAKRVQNRIERWGLLVEHAGLQSIAPTRETLRITQLRLRCEEQWRLYAAIRHQGLSHDEALTLLGPPTRLVAKSVVRYRGYRRRIAVKRPPASTDRRKQPVIKVGDHVWANWWELGDYYPGLVTKIAGDHVHIKYDDGDDELVQRKNISREQPK